jgi:hypothetical protein
MAFAITIFAVRSRGAVIPDDHSCDNSFDLKHTRTRVELLVSHLVLHLVLHLDLQHIHFVVNFPIDNVICLLFPCGNPFSVSPFSGL